MAARPAPSWRGLHWHKNCQCKQESGSKAHSTARVARNDFRLNFSCFGLTMLTSQEMIDLLISALPADATDNDAYILREALKRLVRVAQYEQLQALQEDFDTVDHALCPSYRPPGASY